MEAQPTTADTDTNTEPTPKKPTCRICCACPETKKVRDECIIHNGEEACADRIEAHKACLRSEGFNV